jgi:hypothetical protein
MKQKFLLLFCMLSSAAFAQTRFGAVVGINNSFFTEGVAKGFLIEPSFGMQFGLFAEIKLNESIHFRPKLLYSQQGDRYRTNVDNSSFELSNLDYKLSYINLPLDFKFGKKIYAVAGPQIGVLAGKQAEGVIVSPVQSDIDLGLNLGAGCTFNNLFIEAGIYQGFTTVFQYNYAPTGTLVNANNGAFKLSVGYYFK